jgi:prephenate dehydrogenase
MPLRDAIVTIVGLGQIGGSIGRALVAGRACRRVIGVSRRPSTLRAALRLRAAHETTRDLAAACARADLVILATPVRTILRQIPAAARALRPGALLMDVGSAKAEVMRAAGRACRGRGAAFAGGHPMAGTEGSGIAASNPALFRGRPFVLTGTRALRPGHRRLLAALLRALGARPAPIDARDHDVAVARISHLPHVLAAALLETAAADRTGLAFRLAAGSFRSATRVAAADTDMLLDLLLANRGPVARSIGDFARRLRSFGGALRRGDATALRRRLAAARRRRTRLNRG